MDKRSILITGCSSGIGLDAARTLAARGWRVFATCRVEADCERLRGEGLESFRLDYEDEASIGAAMDEALGRTGGTLDALFNNGAYAIPGFIEDLPTAALRQLFEANVFGWHEATRRALAGMRPRRRGRIVQCSSVLGFAAVPWRGSYVASKYAIEGLTDTLRLELRGTGVHAVLIEPGPIATRFNENALAQFRRWIDPAASLRGEELHRIAERYRAEGRPNPFTLPPSAVTAALIAALDSPRPRARYMVTTPTKGIAVLKRIAPRSLLDSLLARQ